MIRKEFLEVISKTGMVPRKDLVPLAANKNVGVVSELDLLKFNFFDDVKFAKTVAKMFDLTYVDLSETKVPDKTLELVKKGIATKYRIVPLKRQPGALILAIYDPSLIELRAEIQKVVQSNVEFILTSLSSWKKLYQNIHSSIDEILETVREVRADQVKEDNVTEEDIGEDVISYVNKVLAEAYIKKVSDIHVEPYENNFRIRFRLDGSLVEYASPPKSMLLPLVSRMKILSQLDISERRIPQDGRFNIRVKAKSIDVRLSTMPTQYGESVVMRLLDQTEGMLSLQNVGMPPKILSRFKVAISRPHGLVLVTGPTGSGKTTTLYGALTELNKPQVKIITAEDPVEYRLPRITQVQVNAKVGLTFSSVLRACLRQDPDVVLVGEMRDQETAEIGLRAAMTGHLVMSTLHTNYAIGSALRLIDMGAEPYLVASSLQGVMAQRLIRRICPDCATEYYPTEQEKIWISSMATAAEIESLPETYTRGTGCYQCSNTGYKGRIGIYEWLEMDDKTLSSLRRADADSFAAAAKESAYYKPLELCALDFALEGTTTLDEVFRVSATLEDAGDFEDDFELDFED